MKPRIVAVIPARIGSVRVKAKSLRMIAGKPLIYYVINALKKAKKFGEIYVNSDSELIGKVAKRYGVGFYHRKPELATSTSMIDDYIYDFLKNVDCDILAVVNPTSPLVTSEEFDNAMSYFLKNKFDTMLSVQNVQTHCFYKGEPINFSTKGQHPRSQDLEPVKALIFAITVWRAKKFIQQYEKKGHGVYTGKLGFYAFKGFSTVDIDYEEDFAMAQLIMENRRRFEHAKADYDPVIRELIRKKIDMTT